LDSIRAFEQYANQNYGVNVEMSQVSSKENFNAVSIMANILSWAMIVFSIVCIIMFIVNMLQSYFQKVKRNLGTFKAFGINSFELISVYVLIMLAIILAAIVISLSFTWLLQILLPLFGILKDGEFNYLVLWNLKTVCSIIIVIVATVTTVYIVMNRLLKQTPGDLIYDR
jgi:ABC-type antimicrobial peptide transport system permease subunit